MIKNFYKIIILKILKTLNNLHNPKSNLDIFSNDFRRLAYDEILSNLLALYSARKVIKIKKKKKKNF